MGTRTRKYDWSTIVFSDETAFSLNQPAKRLWRRRGERILHRTIKHPTRCHVWGCFSSQGFGKLHLFSENLDARYLCKIYQQTLLSSAEMWFASDRDSWILQEDNDPKHTSRMANQWREEKGVRKMAWPAQEPDQNPIENVWALLKIKVAR